MCNEVKKKQRSIVVSVVNKYLYNFFKYYNLKKGKSKQISSVNQCFKSILYINFQKIL